MLYQSCPARIVVRLNHLREALRPFSPHSPDGEFREIQNVLVAGTTAAGKSTVAKPLARFARKKYLELDGLRYKPSNRKVHRKKKKFHRALRRELAEDGWVLAGNVNSGIISSADIVRNVILKANTAVIWLDYDISVLLQRVVERIPKRKHEFHPRRGRKSQIKKVAKWYKPTRAEYNELFEGRSHVIRVRHPQIGDAFVQSLYVNWP